MSALRSSDAGDLGGLLVDVGTEEFASCGRGDDFVGYPIRLPGDTTEFRLLRLDLTKDYTGCTALAGAIEVTDRIDGSETLRILIPRD